MPQIPLSTFEAAEAALSVPTTLSQDVLDRIGAIVAQITAPDYNRAPQFPKRTKRNHGGGAKGDWERTRKFRITKVKKGDASLDKVRESMNKISVGNYPKLSAGIVVLVKEVPPELMGSLCSLIFEIASTNLFFSKLYAKLFAQLAVVAPELESRVEAIASTYIEQFGCIESPDPVSEYDRFCEVNKINARRRATAAFIANLAVNGFMPKDRVAALLGPLQDRAEELCEAEGGSLGIEEVAEVQFLVVKEVGLALESIGGWTKHCTRLEKFSKRKAKDYPSLTHKAVFRYMDACDLRKKLLAERRVYRAPGRRNYRRLSDE